jgi:NAD(P)-dependent dehydrogenase (short-subunit alcohol dehydrogenase family)
MSKSILIVGAGPGIGQAVARKFGGEGWTVALIGRSADRLASLGAELSATGIAVHTLTADATDPVALRAAVAEADRRMGGLTAVHYNAAVVRQQDLFSMTDAEIESDLAVNVAGGLHTIRAAVEQFGTRGGAILVTGGGLGVTPSADWASLGVGKAALRNIVQALAGPLEARGIRIGIATVATLVAPASKEATEVADAFWRLATDRNSFWEAVYPSPGARPANEGQVPRRTVVITGATSGIGYATALAFAKRGANIAISGRRADRGAEAAAEIERLGGRAWFKPTDVRDAEQVRAFVEGAAAVFGGIDTVIANAGIEPPHVLPLAELGTDDIDAVLDTNLRGTLLTVRYAIPHLRRPGGSIITVSSLWGRQGGARLPVYSATKGASESLTRALAVELGAEGVRVNCVAPGFIKTEMSDRFTEGRDMQPFYSANVPLGRIGQADEIADVMLWLASDEAAFVTGQVITVDGGQNIKMSVAGL